MGKTESLPRKQRGAVLILATIAMVGIVAVLALMFDSSHMFVNKTRLQNMVDAAALSAATVINSSNDPIAARQAALAIFADNASGAGNNEINTALSSGEISVQVEFSNTLTPFAVGSVPELYARVRVEDMDLEQWFLPVLGTADKNHCSRSMSSTRTRA